MSYTPNVVDGSMILEKDFKILQLWHRSKPGFDRKVGKRSIVALIDYYFNPLTFGYTDPEDGFNSSKWVLD